MEGLRKDYRSGYAVDTHGLAEKTIAIFLAEGIPKRLSIKWLGC